MQKDIRFPKPTRQALGRNGFFETTGVSLTEDTDTVMINAWTARLGGEFSEAARILVPFSHLREFRDALDAMITTIEGGQSLASRLAAEEDSQHK